MVNDKAWESPPQKIEACAGEMLEVTCSRARVDPGLLRVRIVDCPGGSETGDAGAAVQQVLDRRFEDPSSVGLFCVVPRDHLKTRNMDAFFAVAERAKIPRTLLINKIDNFEYKKVADREKPNLLLRLSVPASHVLGVSARQILA